MVFTIPKLLRLFFKFKRKLLGELFRCGVGALVLYFQAAVIRRLSSESVPLTYNSPVRSLLANC
jgi:hypothetical protein